MKRGDKMASGMPDADEYDTDSLGNAMIRAGDPEQQHGEYGLETIPVEYARPLGEDEDASASKSNVEADPDKGVMWEDTGRRLVRRNGQYVSDVSSQFKLVPNERVVTAANKAAKRLGAVPFHDFSGDWFIELDDHVFQDHKRHRVHALYAWEDPVDIGDGDTVQFGFAVHNSIDGSQSFEVGLFSFRHACANMVTMGVNGQGQNWDQRDVYAHTERRHTKSLDVDADELAAIIEGVMTFADDVKEGYREWRKQFITPEQVLGLIDRLPAKDLPDWMAQSYRREDEEEEENSPEPVADRLEAAREQKALDLHDDADDITDVDAESVALDTDRVESIVESARPDDETAWETYNSVTESVWHDPGSSDKTKDRKFSKLHRVMEPAEGVR
jgi:hypothetical protein